MTTPLAQKSSIDAIKSRFDQDVERFSNLETGQTTTIDALLAMELITQAAVKATQPIRRVLDIGCGAGNNTLKLTQSVTSSDCDLVNLSRPMLERARKRIAAVNSGAIKIIQGDFRKVGLAEHGYDVILAAAVLHHLRDDKDWETTFQKIYRLTAPRGAASGLSTWYPTKPRRLTR